MTEKRFVNKGKDIFQYGEWWCSANGEHCADVIATAINELIEENEKLKSKNRGLQSELQIFKEDVTHSNLLINKLGNENEQLKQFQDRVFSWIDMHLQRLPTLRDDEFESDNEFADPSLYSGAIQILETMKRELKGDVE